VSLFRSIGIRLVVYPLIAYGALGVGLYFRQTELLFPAPRDFEPLTPANLRMPYDNLRIPVQEAGWLHAWWIPAEAFTVASLRVTLRLDPYPR
jgi:hypothetical protein